jgi:hypothetical protein
MRLTVSTVSANSAKRIGSNVGTRPLTAATVRVPMRRFAAGTVTDVILALYPDPGWPRPKGTAVRHHTILDDTTRA